FYVPDRGRVMLGDRNISGWSPSRIVHQRVARTFQITRVFKRMTVLENMVVPARRTGLKAMFWDGIQGHERARAEHLLEFVGLAHGAGIANGPAATIRSDPSVLEAYLGN